MRRYYADGAPHDYIIAHTWLSLVPYYIKKFNKISTINALNMLAEYNKILEERLALELDIENQQSKLASIQNKQIYVKESIRLDDLKYSYLTYSNPEFYQLRNFIQLVIIAKRNEIQSAINNGKGISDKNMQFMQLTQYIDDCNQIIDILLQLKNFQNKISLPVMKVYKQIRMIQNFSYGNKKY